MKCISRDEIIIRSLVSCLVEIVCGVILENKNFPARNIALVAPKTKTKKGHTCFYLLDEDASLVSGFNASWT
jgi:hypothetical protein